jgi:hypothetical protein
MDGFPTADGYRATVLAELDDQNIEWGIEFVEGNV